MLRLTATDADDLIVISAQMQDAVLNFADMKFDARRRRFALVSNRFAWDENQQKRRRRTGLHFDNVLNVRHQGLDKANGKTILSLLSITFHPTDELAGSVTLAFAANQTLKLDVECLDVAMADFGTAWATKNIPRHEE